MCSNSSMITTVGSTKGGVGKTTLAVNLTIGLALAGQDVLLIDGDGKQQTAIAFSALRSQNHPNASSYTAVALEGKAIRTEMRHLVSRFDHVIVDSGGRDSGSLRSALCVTDLLIIPTEPRNFDLWGAEQTCEVVREAAAERDFRAISVLNCADPSGNANSESFKLMATFPSVEVFPHPIVRRKAWPSATDEGLSVLEHIDPGNREGSIKAREDFGRLLDFLFPERQRKIA